jgi:hypothetical protein
MLKKIPGPDHIEEDEGIEIYGYSDIPKVPHAIVRAKERYNIDLTNEDLRQMSLICQGTSWARDYIKDLGYGKHHIHVKYKDIWFNCIFSSSTKIIVTILDMKADPQPKD